MFENSILKRDWEKINKQKIRGIGFCKKCKNQFSKCKDVNTNKLISGKEGKSHCVKKRERKCEENRNYAAGSSPLAVVGILMEDAHLPQFLCSRLSRETAKLMAIGFN